MTSLTQSVGTVISAHLTDEAASLEVVEAKQFLFFLRLNLLFFDHLAIPVIGILNNPHFASLISKDRESASRLFRSDETGFIRPIVFTYGSRKKLRNPKKIVEKILTRNTRIYLSEDKLYQNAEFIISENPDMYCTEDSSFRSKYHRDLLEIVTLINQEGLQTWQSSASLLPMRSLHDLYDWLCSIDAAKCNCTDAFEIINSNAMLNGDQKKQAKIVAAATWMHSIRGSLIGSLSVPPEYLPLVELFRKLRTTSNTAVLKKIEPFELPIPVPFKEILDLPLRIILELRDLDSFRNIRKDLSKYRKSGESVSSRKLRERIKQCHKELLEFERRGRGLSEEDSSEWEKVFYELSKKEEVSRLKIWRDRATGLSAFVIFLSPFVSSYQPLACFCAGGVCLLDRHINEVERALSTSLAPEAKNDIIYEVVKGTTNQDYVKSQSN